MHRIFFTLIGLAPVALAIACQPTQNASKAPIVESWNAPAIAQPVVDRSSTPRPDPGNYSAYRAVIEQTMAMVRNPEAQSLAQRFGLNILDLTWEDTGRYKNSAVGPNISDMTIQVQQFNPQTEQHELNLMPVIRHPNFSDKSADVDLDSFFLRVGNERGQPLQRVSLREFLGDLRRYLHGPSSWQGRTNSLLAPRDTHALVSAQACFLPIPQGGKAEFNPVLFNYQSYPGNPAVLTILATREGTSVTVIDNQRDGFEAGRTWGQRLFFNQNGDRASLTGQRISDFRATSEDPSIPTTSAAAERQGLNLVMLIQVPLKQKQAMRQSMAYEADMAAPMAPAAGAPMKTSNVEAAVIGHGKVEGPFTEIDNLAIERDPNFPIRVTVQFYKATSNGVVAEADLQEIEQQIARVYEDADFVGSLVTEGTTNRPTEYDGSKQEPPTWWNDFWRRRNLN